MTTVPSAASVSPAERWHMAWRVIVRFSLNNDAGSRVRNAVAPLLEQAGIENTATGTWEAEAATPADVARQLGAVMAMFANVAPPTALDHAWIYVDRVP
jgi:hypothetical protein